MIEILGINPVRATMFFQIVFYELDAAKELHTVILITESEHSNSKPITTKELAWT